MPRFRQSCALVALLASGPGAWGQAEPRYPRLLSPCAVVEMSAYCGVYQVWENRSTRAGRRIPLRVIVIPGEGPNRVPDPVVPLVGGPGEGAAQAAEAFRGAGYGARDVVLVDTRGTGASAPLKCTIEEPVSKLPLLDSLFPGWLVVPCRDRLLREADLRQYTTRNAILDLAEVLDWLGYPVVNLVGGSYGTRTAMEFMRLFPARVRTAFLTAPLAPDVRNLPLEMARSAHIALDQIFQMCDSAPTCRRAFPKLREEFATLLARVSRAPVPVTAEVGGRLRPALLGRTGFGYAIRGALYGGLAQWLPLMIHRAAVKNDFSWFARYWRIRGTWAFEDRFPGGLYLSVICTEDMAPVSDDSVRRATQDTFLGEGLYRQYAAACAQWPRGELPADLHQLVRSDVPTLVISGTRDPVTPAAYGKRVAGALSRGVHIVLQNSGHGGGPACEPILAGALLSQARARGLESTPCATRPAPFAFALSGEPPARLMR